jgi:hypothetical protein
MNVLVAEMELIVWLPEVALAPDQAPVAPQLEALLAAQLSCVEPPCATVFGAALSETVGADAGGAGGDPGGNAFPLLSGTVSPPPQAAKPNAHSNASVAP